jgi:hypothetical protein
MFPDSKVTAVFRYNKFNNDCLGLERLNILVPVLTELVNGTVRLGRGSLAGIRELANDRSG